ncbi:cytoplasmic protein [Shewanella seohaensis]|uniref:Cytoplasmic protein n=1 Tax=Shewanella seohaensis TaxID=755175 RepID=A0ABV4VVE5_9GAMM
MSISLNTQAITPNLENGAVGVKVAQLAKEQQKAEGQMVVDLINAAIPQPVGNSGHNINTTA